MSIGYGNLDAMTDPDRNAVAWGSPDGRAIQAAANVFMRAIEDHSRVTPRQQAALRYVDLAMAEAVLGLSDNGG